MIEVNVERGSGKKAAGLEQDISGPIAETNLGALPESF